MGPLFNITQKVADQPLTMENITRETTPYSALPRIISDTSQDEAISKWDIGEFGFDLTDLGFPGVGTGVRKALGLAVQPLVSAGKVIPVGDALQAFAMLPQKAKNLLKNTKVTDEAGEPIPVYHGTMSAFQEFDPGITSPTGLFGPGTYFTELARMASEYAGMLFQRLGLPNRPGGSVHKAYLDIERPLDIDADLDGDLLRAFVFDAGREKNVFGKEVTNIQDHRKTMDQVDEASNLEGWTNIPGHGLPEGTFYNQISKKMQDIQQYTGEQLDNLSSRMGKELETDMMNFLDDLPYNMTDADVAKMPWLKEFMAGEGVVESSWPGPLTDNFEIRNMPMWGEFVPNYGEKWLEPFSEIVRYSYQPVFVPKYPSGVSIQEALELNKKYLDVGSSQYDIVSYTDDPIPTEVQGWDSLLDMVTRVNKARVDHHNFMGLDDELRGKIFKTPVGIVVTKEQHLTLKDIDQIKELQLKNIRVYLDGKGYMEYQNRGVPHSYFTIPTTSKSAMNPVPNNHQLYEFITVIQAMTTGYHNSRTATNTFLGRNGVDGITHIGGRWVGDEEHKVWIAFDPGIVTDPVTQKTGTKTSGEVIRPFATVEGPLGGTMPGEMIK
jgi:hypothetical protein